MHNSFFVEKASNLGEKGGRSIYKEREREREDRKPGLRMYEKQ